MRALITAGPTREPIDPVRFLSNRSTGKMGFALAETGVARGHHVILVAGPVGLPTPPGARREDITTAEEMCRAVERELAGCDVLIMAAAVADWRPAEPRATKWKKGDEASTHTLALERTPDILRTVFPSKGSRLFVGFAAETGNLLDEARRKRADKGLDLMVANDVSQPGAGFEVDTNRVTLIDDAREEELPLLSKHDVANRIWERVESLRNGA